MEDWVPLPFKVKMDGVGWYGFGLTSEQSVHAIIPGDMGAVSIVVNVMIMIIIISNIAVLDSQTLFIVHNAEVITHCGVRQLA
jgi:hypothetical protein